MRIAAWGSSAGGHLVALLGTSGGVPDLEDLTQGNADQSSRLQAVVDWFGPTDFTALGPQHHLPGSAEGRLLGCGIDLCPDRVAFANPITYIDPRDPPFLIQHGTSDATVDPNQSELLHAALLAAAVPSTLVMLEGAGHGGPEFAAASNQALVDAFLDARLAKGTSAP